MDHPIESSSPFTEEMNKAFSLHDDDDDDDNADDHKNGCTLLPAAKASPQALESVALWLSQQWPRGGDPEAYLEKISEKSSSGPNGLCPCSFILHNNTTSTPVGHGRILDCFENSGAKAAAFTYILTKPQGYGYGRNLMQQLEQVCRDHHYHYVYVWTHTAIEFYKKCGYHVTHRVSLQRPCLKSLETTQVSKLEDLLSSRRRRIFNDDDDDDYADTTKKTSETVMLPPDSSAGQEDVWLCKRLVETVPSLLVPRQERLSELEQFRSSIVSTASDISDDSRCCCYYHLLDLPWQQQIGPSCGLAALQMVLDFSGHTKEQSKLTKEEQSSLLQQAQAQGYTQDGELFDIQDLFNLATCQGLACNVVNVSETTPMQVCQQLLVSNLPIILPYDQAHTRLPCLSNGKSAHYGVIVGMLVLISDKHLDKGILMKSEPLLSNGNFPGNTEKRLVSLSTLLADDQDRVLRQELLPEEAHSTAGSRKLYLLVQHGMSRSLCIASWDDFMTSNQQLQEIDHAKFLQHSERRPLNLANQMLFVKGKLSDI